MHSYPILVITTASLLFGTVVCQKEDFGTCTPTMSFELGRAEFNRATDEGTFFPDDERLIANTSQTDALSPNIITSFICDQLVNVCGATDAAINTCNEAQAMVAGLDATDETTAEAFNQALGF